MSTPEVYSRFHRMLDGLAAMLHRSRRPYRKELLRLLAAARTGWPSADYGAGYLYQSFPPLGLHGFRQTEVRQAQMAITDALRGQRVLEIGCNSGFLSLALSPGARRYVGFDNNPFLIDIARLTQKTVRNEVVDFRVDTVEAFESDEPFDVVLSFANHSTWDGNMTLALEAYFSKLQKLLVPEGTLFFESHHPALENKAQVQETLKVMQKFFAIQQQRELTCGSAWDRGRSFVEARSLIKG